MFIRTARLDLDDYNNDTEDGLHITSMAGTWMSLVKGFGGLRVKDNKLHLNPQLPENWKGYSFRIIFRNRVLRIVVSREKATTVILESGQPLEIILNHQAVVVK
jgi:maltose phosphorylase